MSLLRYIRLAGLALLLAAAAPVSAAAQDADRPLTVVELFTSQGCPLCPAADAFLGELRRRGDVLALSFHVDYWDYIGWPDPFAEPAYTHRQQQYLAKLGFPYVFTPQMIVDGVYPVAGNERAAVLEVIARARAEREERVSVSVSRLSDGQVRVRIPAAPARYRGAFDILLLHLDTRRETEVLRGENAGKTLVNYNVVRLMRPLAEWHGEAFDRIVTLMELAGGPADRCVVLVQERGLGRIYGAAVTAMR